MTLPPGQPPQAYTVYKPGGLSGTAHAVHIVLILLTLGLWLPVYIIFILAAPKVRTEVIVPYGTDPATLPAPVVDPVAQAQAQRQAKAAEWRAAKIGIGVFGLGVLFVGVTILAMVLFSR